MNSSFFLLQFIHEENIFYLILVLNVISFIISFGLGIYAFRLKTSKIALYFFWLMIIFGLWSLNKTIVLFIYDLDTRAYLSNFITALSLFIPTLALLIVICNTKFPKWFKEIHHKYLFIIPAILAILSISAPFHNLMLYDYEVKDLFSTPNLNYKIGIGFKFSLFHLYFCLFISLFILIKSLFNSNSFFRNQIIFIIIAICIPTLNDLLYRFHISIIPGYHLIGLSFSIGNCFLAWALFGYRFLKLVPIARSQVIDNINDIMIITNFENLVVDINKSCKKIFNISNQEIIGMSYFEVFKSYPELLELSKTTKDGEISIILSSQKYYFSVSHSTVEYSINESLAHIILLHDITDRKKYEIQLKELNQTKDKFFSIISHDLKNPFHSLIGFSELLIENLSAFEHDEAKQCAEMINISANSGYKLLENLLLWARTQTGGIDYNPERVSIQEVISNSINFLSGQALSKKINLISEISLDFHPLVDYNMLNTVIRNLISNGIKFTPIGGEIKISIDEDFDDNFYIISVKDSGIGIKETDIIKLFRIDISHSTKGTAQEKGSGLGLILCKEFVERHGGKIWVESEFGKGSNFKFTLPK